MSTRRRRREKFETLSGRTDSVDRETASRVWRDAMRSADRATTTAADEMMRVTRRSGRRRG